MSAERKPKRIYKVKAKDIRRFSAVITKLNALMDEIREYNKDAELLVIGGNNPALVLLDAPYINCPQGDGSDKSVQKRAIWFEKHGCDGGDIVGARSVFI